MSQKVELVIAIIGSLIFILGGVFAPHWLVNDLLRNEDLNDTDNDGQGRENDSERLKKRISLELLIMLKLLLSVVFGSLSFLLLKIL